MSGAKGAFRFFLIQTGVGGVRTAEASTCAIGVDRASKRDVAVAAACSIAMDRSGVKRKARYSIFSRRDDGSLLLDTSATPSSSDDARTPAPVGRPFRSGLLLTVVVIVALLAIPKIFHITVTLPKVGCMGIGEVPAWGDGCRGCMAAWGGGCRGCMGSVGYAGRRWFGCLGRCACVGGGARD